MLKLIFILTNALVFFSLSASEINVYSSRHYNSDLILHEKFTKLTGIKVNIISGKSKALEKRIEEEWKDFPADLFIVADAGRLHSAQKKNLFQKFNSKKIEQIVPANFRTEFWFGIAKRARIFFVSKNNPNTSVLKNISYINLADPEWEKKVLIRSSNNIYNQSLVSHLIEINGYEITKQWAKKLVSNMARPPQGNDRSQLLGVASGDAELAVANTYYYALMLSGQKGKEQKEAAKKLLPIFPNQKYDGTHMNISGVGILKNAKNIDNAIKFSEFLLSKQAQVHIVNNTFEYPMLENIKPHQIISEMGTSFKQSSIDVSTYGKWQSDALKLMIESGWN